MILKISPDKERAKSMKKIITKRKESFKFIKQSNFPSIICENYYEIIKELLTAIGYCYGFKTIGTNAHKELIKELHKKEILNSQEHFLINELRIKRNNSGYYGKETSPSYLKNNEKFFIQIIKKLENILTKLLIK